MQTEDQCLSELSFYPACVQGFLREAYAANVAQECDKADVYSNSIQMATAYWSVLAPQLYAWGASMDNLNKVTEALTADEVNYPTVSVQDGALRNAGRSAGCF